MSDDLTRALAFRLATLERKTQRIEAQEYTGGTATGGVGTAVFNDASGNPAEVGTASLDGISEYAARLDHVHEFPRALLFSDASGNPVALGTASSDGVSTYAARLDHVHEISGIFSDAAGNPGTVGTASSDGVLGFASRLDHTHAFDRGLMFTTTAPAGVGTANATGASTYAARIDHVHAQASGLGTAAFDDSEGDPAVLGTVAADGVSTFAARRDHAHHLLGGTIRPQAIRPPAGGYLNLEDEGGQTVAKVAGTVFYVSDVTALDSGGITVLDNDASPSKILMQNGTASLLDYNGAGFVAGNLIATLRDQNAVGYVRANAGTVAIVGGTVGISGSVSVAGAATLSSTLSVQGSATMGSALSVQGSATLGKTTTINAPMIIGNDPSDGVMGARFMTPSGFTVNDEATVALETDAVGLLMIICTSDVSVAIFGFSTPNAAVWEIADPSNVFSATADTTSSTNLYVSSTELILQNRRGVSKGYRIYFFGGTFTTT